LEFGAPLDLAKYEPARFAHIAWPPLTTAVLRGGGGVVSDCSSLPTLRL